MRLLLIEDDQSIAENVQHFLARKGFVTEIATDGEDGEFRAMEESFDAIILDINLPLKNGFEIIQTLRENHVKTPVLMLTAYSDVDNRIKGLNLGADDYVPKPFSMEELAARLQALIRRSAQDPSPTIIIDNLEIDPLAYSVTIDGQKIELASKEFAVLEFLARNQGNVITRSMILDHVWGSEFETLSNVVDVYIKNLRNKLEPYSKKKLIHTIRGKGYILKTSP